MPYIYNLKKLGKKRKHYNQTMENGQTMLEEWKSRCVACEATIEFSKDKNRSQEAHSAP
jgi:hypothetical protein